MLKKLKSYIKNNPRGNILGSIIIVVAVGSLYMLTEIGFKEKQEVLPPNIDLKTVKGEDRTTLIDKEKQLKAYIEDDKERAKKEDFFIKSVYYVNDDNKRTFDGTTLNIKDLEIVGDKIINEEEKPEIIEIKKIEPKVEPKEELKEKLKVVEEEKIEVKKVEPKVEKKEVDVFDVKPDVETLTPDAALQYKMDRLIALSNFIPSNSTSSQALNIEPNPALNETVEDSVSENKDLYIIPGSSFYGYLENNLNSIVDTPVAIIRFTSKELKGYKGIGRAKVNQNSEGLSVLINEIIDPSGKRIKVNAFAIDNKDFSASFADEVDKKTLRKFALTSSSILLNAFGDAKQEVENSGTTTSVTDGGVVTSTVPVKDFNNLFYGNIASNAGESIDRYLVNELANTKNEIKVNSGKSLVVIFY